MSDLGDLSYFLGKEFLRIERGMILHQRKYVKKFLKRFNMLEFSPATSLIEANLRRMELRTRSMQPCVSR